MSLDHGVVAVRESTESGTADLSFLLYKTDALSSWLEALSFVPQHSADVDLGREITTNLAPSLAKESEVLLIPPCDTLAFVSNSVVQGLMSEYDESGSTIICRKGSLLSPCGKLASRRNRVVRRLMWISNREYVESGSIGSGPAFTVACRMT